MPRIHLVKQGDCLLTIAHRYGHSDHQTIYDHPENADLARLRPDPTMLVPGDRVFVPDPDPPPRLSVSPGGEHRFRARVPTTELRARIEDEAGEPLANRKIKVRFGSRWVDGTTGGDGTIDQRVPLSTRDVDVYVWLDPNAQPGPGDDVSGAYHLVFSLGHLDPVSEVSGVQARLANLGLLAGHTSGVLDPRTTAAIAAFQRMAGLDPSGEADEATRSRLLDLHGGR